MKKTFKENINEYYQTYHLPRRQLLRLQNILRRSRPFFELRHSQSIWATVAVAVVLVMVTLVTFKPLSRPDNLKKLISEIADNHNKNLDIEIRSNSLEEVRDFLSELDFSLIKSQRLSPDTWGLIGGRYCSLLGQFAAQLKMRNKLTNNNYTFYQVQKPPSITEISGSAEYYEKGVKVNLWIERGLILALAGNSE